MPKLYGSERYCVDICPMTNSVCLLENLISATDELLLEIHVKSELISSLRLDLQETFSFAFDAINRNPDPTCPRFAKNLAAMAALCHRLYFGAIDLLPKRKETLALRILPFFVYFQYPLDLEEPSPGIDDSFLRAPPQ
jgi:hypothetical protein